MMTPMGTEMAAMGAGSFILSGISSLFANSMKDRHEEHLASLAASSKNFKLTVSDTGKARQHSFPFARRAIVLSVFILIPVLMYLLAKGHFSITIPYHKSSSYLFGLFHSDSYQFKTVQGFVLMMHPLADVMAMTAGFYFGSRFKR